MRTRSIGVRQLLYSIHYWLAVANSTSQLVSANSTSQLARANLDSQLAYANFLVYTISELAYANPTIQFLS